MYDDDDPRFDEYEDRWEPRGDLDPSEPGGGRGGNRRTPVAIAVAVVIALAIGIAGFAVGSTVGSSTDTVEKTVTDIVTATTTGENTTDDEFAPGGGSVDCAQGPSAKKGFEPNDTPDKAAGPLVSGEPLKGELRETQDVDYWIFCVRQPTQITLSLTCARGACDDVLATFPANADFGDTFGIEKPLTCKLPRAGHYRIAVDSDVVPVIYRIGVEAKDPTVVVDNVPPKFPDENPAVTC